MIFIKSHHEEINSENLDIFYIKFINQTVKLHINDELSLINEIKIFFPFSSYVSTY